jgi:hypothetical protein
MKSERGGACSTVGERRVHTAFWGGKLKEGDHVKDPGVEEKTILKLVLNKYDMRYSENGGFKEGANAPPPIFLYLRIVCFDY